MVYEASIGPRYRLLELIGQGGMGKVSKAVDRLTGRIVALKQVLTLPAADGSQSHESMDPTLTPVAQEHLLASLKPTAGTRRLLQDGSEEDGDILSRSALQQEERRLALAQEFRTLATLRHPNIISVLDYGFDRDHQPFFTMELLQRAQPLLSIATKAPFAVQIDLIFQILRALSYLHRHRIIHRDIKPGNVLAIPTVDGAGWCIKLLDFGLASRSSARGQIVGTPAYMAPELLNGDRASVASDLYAVGMLAAEMLLGAHPFDNARDDSQLVAQILHSVPDLSGLAHEKLGRVLGRAIAKSPAQRPPDAQTFLRELTEATLATPMKESAEARDSYLVAAPFTGREAELGRLVGALNRTRFGHGAAWLLIGESGVGKSRLVEELRSLALVNTVLVARGQAVSAGGGALTLWQEALRLLCLQTDLSELEANVLGTLLPDLATLLERELHSPPELDAQGTQARLLRVITDLIVRQPQPLLLLLDDLQWADAESLALLRQVTRAISSRRLMIVACARADEAPQLPDELPDFQVLTLHRLDAPQLRRLCISMLGAPGRDSTLLALINRETEGNTFFVVEVLRALAEESGSLEEIMQRSLPARVLVGGVQQVLSRRLERVPESARQFLQLAAVAGRQLDLDVLGRIFPDVESLVQACAGAGVLEVQAACWRFSHDKLREQLLSQLDAETARTLHGRLAETIALGYPQDPIRAGVVAHHFQQAQRLSEAAGSYAIAGEAALLRGSLFDAVNLLEQAARLHDEASRPRLEQLRVWRGITLARHGLWRQRDVDPALRHVFALIGHPLPQSRRGLWLELTRQAGRQLASWLSQRLPISIANDLPRAYLHELGEALYVSEVYIWLGPPEMLVICLLWCMNVALQPGFEKQRLGLLLMLAFLLSLSPLRRYSERCLEFVAEQMPRHAGTPLEARYMTVQAITRAERGEWSTAIPWAQTSIERSRQQGDILGLQRKLAELLWIQLNSADTEVILRLTTEMRRHSEESQTPSFAAFAGAGEGLVFMWRGELQRARQALSLSHENATKNNMPHTALTTGGVLAECWLALGDVEQARAQAAKMLQQFKGAQLTISHLAFGLCGVMAIYFERGEAEGRVPKELHEALHCLERLAARALVAGSALERCRGRVAWLAADVPRAVRHMERSRELAMRMGLPREEAWARYFLGRFARHKAARPLIREPARVHLETALTLLNKLAAHGDAEQVRAELQLHA